MYNKVSLCKKDVCFHVEGEWAQVIAAAIFVATLAYGINQAVKLLR